MTDVGIEPPLCHPHKFLVGIHLKGNEDGCLMMTVGHDGEEGFSPSLSGFALGTEPSPGPWPEPCRMAQDDIWGDSCPSSGAEGAVFRPLNAWNLQLVLDFSKPKPEIPGFPEYVF